jgi:hypothetical protein
MAGISKNCSMCSQHTSCMGDSPFGCCCQGSAEAGGCEGLEGLPVHGSSSGLLLVAAGAHAMCMKHTVLHAHEAAGLTSTGPIEILPRSTPISM